MTNRFKNNYNQVFKNLVNGLKSYIIDNNMKSMVLGISGGIDSTVVAAICHEVSKQTKVPLLGFSLPCSTNKEVETTAADITGKAFCDVYTVLNIEDWYQYSSKFLNSIKINDIQLKGTPISEGNIKARLRMITLWNVGGLCNGLVMDSDMLTENLLGFFTINGDSNAFTPIGGLWKTEVYELAKYLKDSYNEKGDTDKVEALKQGIEITPTDGNGVSNSDLDQIAPGLNYNQVDEILDVWVHLNDKVKDLILNGNKLEGSAFAKLVDIYGEDIVMGIVKRNVNSAFKRKHLPLEVNPLSGEVIEAN